MCLEPDSLSCALACPLDALLAKTEVIIHTPLGKTQGSAALTALHLYSHSRRER